MRDTMGYIRRYADRMNLAGMTPKGKLSSTGHALVTADSCVRRFSSTCRPATRFP